MFSKNLCRLDWLFSTQNTELACPFSSPSAKQILPHCLENVLSPWNQVTHTTDSKFGLYLNASSIHTYETRPCIDEICHMLMMLLCCGQSTVRGTVTLRSIVERVHFIYCITTRHLQLKGNFTIFHIKVCWRGYLCFCFIDFLSAARPTTFEECNAKSQISFKDLEADY